MMRSWGERADTYVCDEPFYACYLEQSGRRDHPVSEEVIARHETDPRRVVDWLTGEIPDGKSVFYQKHMAHHMLPGIDRGWLAQARNVFLIREPREAITSLVKKVPDLTLQDTGFDLQAKIFREVVKQTGEIPPVIDSRDVLENPERLLRLLCEALGLEFSPDMLSWAPGLRDTDGVWAKHWYAEVAKSTGFQPYRKKPDPTPAHLKDVEARCEEYYQELRQHRLR